MTLELLYILLLKACYCHTSNRWRELMQHTNFGICTAVSSSFSHEQDLPLGEVRSVKPQHHSAVPA